MFEKFIENRFKGYRHQLNNVDKSLPIALEKRKNVAVIGAGLAGMSAAAYLAPRGFKIDVFEKDSFIGGKIGSWPVTFDDGYQTNVEHGFHGFFRQYYNLLDLLEKVGAKKNLIPLSDYLIKTLTIGDFSFKKIATTPILNLLSMARHGIYSFSQMMSKTRSSNLMPLLQYDREKTFEKYDQISFKQFAGEANLPKQLHLIFTTFARAFFAEPQYMSLGELIKSFHFYFLSNDLGIIYDVLDNDFEESLWTPFTEFLDKYDTRIHTNTAVENIGYQDGKFILNNSEFDYLIIASDVKNTPKLMANSPDLKKTFPSVTAQLSDLKTSQRYAVLRIWINKNVKGDLPFFIFTDAVKILDSITIYHQMEKTSAQWVEKNGGGIFELHSYAVPDDMVDGDEVRKQLLIEFEQYFPEVSGYKIQYENFQFRDDFTAFHTGLYQNRPGFKTEAPNLFLAGDWVKLPSPAMLMEAATTSALYTANEIFNNERLQSDPLFSVPLRGILSKS
jgi:isorenieratene synthase